MSEIAAKRVHRPNSSATANSSSPQVANHQLSSVDTALNGQGKPFCQSAQGTLANQFLPRSLVIPDSQNSQARIKRSAVGQTQSPARCRLCAKAA